MHISKLTTHEEKRINEIKERMRTVNINKRVIAYQKRLEQRLTH
jgi:hypothetical protein